MKKIEDLINKSNHILIIQADNPDGDSLCSALALEDIFGEMGKKTTMFCGVDIPGYLRYIDGWDRVVNQVPNDFDLSIIVDTSALMLLETLDKTGQLKWVKAKPSIIIDHHSTDATIDFADIHNQPEDVSCTEVIYDLAGKFDWPISKQTGWYIVAGILSDSLGLTTENVTSKSVRVIADIVEKGVSLAEIDGKRREHQRKQPELLKYKGDLLKRVEYVDDQKIASITIPWPEIEKYSPLYNPPMLVLDEMRQVEKVCLAIAFKTYPDGRITGKIRSNSGYKIADKIAEHFGGGGHVYASGFRVTDGRKIDEIKQETFKIASELIKKIESDETI
ncbi:DHH family phosphoesterase [Candidatus Saccharibacteria bacterium]|nr:DHH family phosphoesterase [Candidatus Saccharibacteria bacterium]